MSIFEKIGEKLSGAGQGVAQQVKNFADVARLNSIISEKEKQIAQLYIEIGQAYYPAFPPTVLLSSVFADGST